MKSTRLLLSVAALPAVDFPTIQITANLPGASPETMGASVAGPIERQLSTIAGITSLTSTSSLGLSTIIIQFDLNRNIDGAALDVQTALTVAQKRLPIEMTTPPSFNKTNPSESPVVMLAVKSATLPISVVDEYAETVLSQQITQLPGVAQVEIYGAQKYATRVQVDPVAAAARNVSLDDIRRVLAATNSNSPVGTLYGPNQNVTLDATAPVVSAEAERCASRGRSWPPCGKPIVVPTATPEPFKMVEASATPNGLMHTLATRYAAASRQPSASSASVNVGARSE